MAYTHSHAHTHAYTLPTRTHTHTHTHTTYAHNTHQTHIASTLPQLSHVCPSFRAELGGDVRVCQGDTECWSDETAKLFDVSGNTACALWFPLLTNATASHTWGAQRLNTVLKYPGVTKVWATNTYSPYGKLKVRCTLHRACASHGVSFTITPSLYTF